MKTIKQVLLIGVGLLALAMVDTDFGQTTTTTQDAFTGINLTDTPVQAEPLAMDATDMASLRTLSDAQLASFVTLLDVTPLLLADDLPRQGRSGTFYSLQHPEWPPLPCNVRGVPVWPMNNFYLLNDLECDYTAPVISLQAGLRAMAMTSQMASGNGDSGIYLSEPGGYMVDTNGLWLEITNVANGWSYLNLHHATNLVYEILSKTNLLEAEWNIETALWPTTGQTNVLPFAVPTLNRETLFVRAMDWTGVDSDSDGIPDWWEWKNFGDFNQTATNDFDGDGVNNGDEHTNGTDPNKIVYWLSATSQYVSSSSATVGLDISNGVPFSVATLVDNTNFSAATWLPYAGNPTVDLGTTEGWHDVWIGLRGLPVDAPEVWRWERLKLDFTPPLLVITNPTNGVVTQPMIQLQGCSPEALASISYDIANAAGVLTNQPVLILDQHYDTNTFEFTTNTFQAFDVDLTNGVNLITLHATDLAGNVTTTNFSFTLDYAGKTNPPVVQLIWPQDGMTIAGNSFTGRGWVDEFTATVTASLVDTNGVTNIFNALVERNGKFWLEGLPLAGTSLFTLTITDAAGNITTTNLTVIQGAVVLALNPVSGDLWQPTVSVSGTVSDGSCSVSVNGVEAAVSGTSWSAANVPVSAGGVALFEMTASAAGGGSGAQQQAGMDKPSRLFASKDFLANGYSHRYHVNDYDGTGAVIYWWEFMFGFGHGHGWLDGAGGQGQELGTASRDEPNYSGHWLCTTTLDWLADGTGTATGSGDCGTGSYAIGAPYISMSHWDHFSTETVSNYWGWEKWVYYMKSQTSLKLYTGGKALPKRQNLFAITGSAVKMPPLPFNPPEPMGDGIRPPGVPTETINPLRVLIGGLGRLGSDGKLYVALPDDATLDATPFVAGEKNYSFNAGAQKCYLVSRCNCPRQDLTRTTVGVGEVVSIYFSSDASGNSPYVLPVTAPITWTTTAGSLSPTASYCGTVLTSPSTATTATVKAALRGATLNIPFRVIEPSGVQVTVRAFQTDFSPGSVGAGMYLDVVLQPTSVSFGRLEMTEPAEATTGITGYFINHTPPTHAGNGAGDWHPVNCDNLIVDNYFDHAWSGGWPIGVSGTYTWPIHPVWRIVGNSTTHSLSGWTDQVMTLSADGTMRIDKLGHFVWRTP